MLLVYVSSDPDCQKLDPKNRSAAADLVHNDGTNTGGIISVGDWTVFRSVDLEKILGVFTHSA